MFRQSRIQVLRDFCAFTPQLNLRDSPEALAFLVSQLAYVEATIYEKLRAPLDYTRLVPVSNAADEGAKTIVYRMRDYAGRGRRHNLKGRDLPRVDVYYGEKAIPVHGGAIAYAYTFEELRTAAKLMLPLETDRADAAVQAYERHLNQIALYGEYDLTGIFNSPDVPVMPAIHGNWLDPGTTPDDILWDINFALTQLWVQTKRNSVANRIVLPGPQFGYIASTPRSSGSDYTILNYVLENNISMVENNVELVIIGGPDLDEAGVNGASRMLVYQWSETNLVMHVPMPLIFHAPQIMGLEAQVPAEYKYAGVEWRYPMSGLFIDGI